MVFAPTPFVTDLHVDTEPPTTTPSAIISQFLVHQTAHPSNPHLSNTETRTPCATVPNTLHVSVWMAPAALAESCPVMPKCGAVPPEPGGLLQHILHRSLPRAAGAGNLSFSASKGSSPPQLDMEPGGSCVAHALFWSCWRGAARGQALLCTYTHSHVFCLIGAQELGYWCSSPKH